MDKSSGTQLNASLLLIEPADYNDTIYLRAGKSAVIVSTTRYFCDTGSWDIQPRGWPNPDENIVDCAYRGPVPASVPDVQMTVKARDIAPAPVLNDTIDVTSVMPTGPLTPGVGYLALYMMTHLEALPGIFGEPALLYIGTRIQIFQGSQRLYSRDFYSQRMWWQLQASVTFQIG